MQKVAWFNDIVTFWQQWQTLPFSHLENYFYDKENARLPLYTLGSEEKRISCLMMFQSGIKPEWEDKVNASGSEFQFVLGVPYNEKG